MKMPRDRYIRIKYGILSYVESIGHNRCVDYYETIDAMRYRWDLFWGSRRAIPDCADFDLYADGINDDHIDTVLRNVVKELNLTTRKD